MDIAKKVQNDWDVAGATGLMAGVAHGAYTGVAGPIGAVAGAAVGGLVGGITGVLACQFAITPVVVLLQRLFGIRYYTSEGLLEAATAIIAHLNQQSAILDAITKGHFEGLKEKLKAFIELDEFNTKTLNDEIRNVRPATLAVKEDLPECILVKVNPEVFDKFSPLDENASSLEEIEAGYSRIDFKNLNAKDFEHARETYQQGLDKGELLLNILQGNVTRSSTMI